MRLPRFPIRTLMIAVAVVALFLGSVLAYRHLTQPPPEVYEFIRTNPDQPPPEMIEAGMSPALIGLLIAVPIATVVALLVAWRRGGLR